ncbi:hypothetical protein F2Q68_00012422 [Brassica cretica]|uniref:2-isopropylmalate synthase/homocitrate synthase post-catalytic domain-containing protein n=1 Tax=Brassica cretica TaxID=69181 RepID=A0A8S9KW49_BRACR|nr:hypothetical protein F2Q68_00012422 [Brassica cretica]
MALKCRGAFVMDGVYTRIDTRQIMATSKMVQEYTGLYVQPHKPIVGANCFVHESGIHQDGILKNRSTYEILSPEDVGVVKSQNSGIVLGKLSGRHAVKGRLKELGYEISDEKLNEVFSRFRDLTKQKKRVTDDDLKALVTCGDEIFSSEKLNGTNDNEINRNGYVPSPQISSVRLFFISSLDLIAALYDNYIIITLYLFFLFLSILYTLIFSFSIFIFLLTSVLKYGLDICLYGYALYSHVTRNERLARFRILFVTNSSAGKAFSDKGIGNVKTGDLQNWIGDHFLRSKNWEGIKRCMADSTICKFRPRDVDFDAKYLSHVKVCDDTSSFLRFNPIPHT